MPELRIGTWNVEYGLGGRKNPVRREIIASNDCDVWVLTETHESLDLSESHQAFSSAQRHSGGQVDEKSHWVTIWVRSELNPRRLKTANDDRTSSCLIQTSQGPMVIFGTVLPWYGDTAHGSYVDEVRHQSEDWNRLANENDSALCVAGDFNMNIGGRHYYGSEVGRAELVRSLEESGLKTVTTYGDVRQDDRDYGLIDHIAVSHHFGNWHKEIAVWGRQSSSGMHLSDHCGVRATFEMPSSQ